MHSFAIASRIESTARRQQTVNSKQQTAAPMNGKFSLKTSVPHVAGEGARGPSKNALRLGTALLCLIGLLSLLPLSAFAQEEKAAEKAAAQKARQEAAAKQQASPES